MPQKNKKNRKKIVILGGGITGLTSAYYLSKNFDVLVVEKGKVVGGSAQGFKYKDFILDYGPHKLYTELPGIMGEIAKITPLLKIKKKNSIYLQGNYYDFPLKLSQIATKMPSKALLAGFDILKKSFSKLPDDSYENFLINRFGKTLYNLSFKDYAGKVWNSDPKELDKELAIRRVAVSGIFELIKSVLIKDTKKISAEYFYYPPYGIKQLIESLVKRIQANGGKILTSTELEKIEIKNQKVESVKIKNKKIKTDYLISTIYLDNLLELMKTKKEVLDSAKRLKYQRLNIFYFILNKPKALRDCWIFFPEGKLLFHRVSEQKAFSPHLMPNNQTVIMVETTKEVSDTHINKIISQLESVGILKKSDIKEYFIKSYDRTYPIYDRGFLKYLNKVLEYLDNIGNLYTIGRPGLFNYNNMDQCWDMSIKTANHIKNKGSRHEWKEIKNYFDNYRIVD